MRPLSAAATSGSLGVCAVCAAVDAGADGADVAAELFATGADWDGLQAMIAVAAAAAHKLTKFALVF